MELSQSLAEAASSSCLRYKCRNFGKHRRAYYYIVILIEDMEEEVAHNSPSVVGVVEPIVVVDPDEGYDPIGYYCFDFSSCGV